MREIMKKNFCDRCSLEITAYSSINNQIRLPVVREPYEIDLCKPCRTDLGKTLTAWRDKA